ncbi:MAG TPA: ACP S-malonyltransferase [Candidatus Bathyarchaeia archaeon]|nr:ACP S-malonyltransferase [Candidatus Bathyarchaeia archaeon]
MKVVFIFPGCGSQYVGMVKELYDTHRIVQEYFEEASNCLSINFVKLCFASSDAELARVSQATTALFLASCSAAALLIQEGIVPSLLIGFNDGEYGALHTASSINFPDGLYLLAKYSVFYEELLATGDYEAAVIKGLPTQVLEELCLKASEGEQIVYISITAGVLDHVVGGHGAAVQRLYNLVGMYSNVSIGSYSVQAGLHSILMQPVADQLKVYLEKIDFKNGKIPVISSLDGQLVSQGVEVKKRVMEQIIRPLEYARLLDILEQYDIVVELVNGTMLSKLIQQRYPKKFLVTIKRQNDIEILQELLK